MDAEELVHCQTVARILVNRVLSKISQRFGRLILERAVRSEQANQHHHGGGDWREDDALAAEELSPR